MVAKEVLDIQYDASDRSQLPFFSLTEGASQYFYFCRRFSLADGGDVLVITRSEDGTCAARLYFTGPILLEDEDIGLGDYPFTTDFSTKVGFKRNALAAEIDEATWQKIFEVMDREREEAYQSRGVTPQTFDRALEVRAPLIDTELPIDSSILERLVRLSTQPHLPERSDGIAHESFRVVAFDGTKTYDFTADHQVPTWGEILKTVERIAKAINPNVVQEKPWPSAANWCRELRAFGGLCLDLCLFLIRPWRR